LIEPRLTSDFQISAIKRLTEAGGDFATVLHKGEPTSGAILLIGQIRGRDPVLFDRYPSLDGISTWQPIPLQSEENDGEIATYWKKRVFRDRDLWVLELDVASPERLNGLLTSST
jgi:hypothetical protein